MTNIFQTSLENGKQAAKDVTENRAQVKEVLEQLKLVLDSLTESEGQTRITREYRDLLQQKPTGYMNLSYFVPSVKKSMSVFRFKQDESGYPFIIDHQHDNIFCENKEALIRCISRILEDGQLVLKAEAFKASLR
ncbi:TPA: hypothetical protein ACN35N_004443 [Vibrio parahaemolyticus]|nr:hypothetical protein [Vibrio parahaemolyticus]MBE3830574.1 hypothetical protein [Vibrio parahaemolyticus]MBE3986175.1 hypothetical protein [Vibrio parahaemolyticus]TON79803.1 hypothetical protein CGH48_25025 [Vibrio parahaemolyticus]HCG7195219.1 hypothetical protein [Vibrio parahaemolyticus]